MGGGQPQPVAELDRYRRVVLGGAPGRLDGFVEPSPRRPHGGLGIGHHGLGGRPGAQRSGGAGAKSVGGQLRDLVQRAPGIP